MKFTKTLAALVLGVGMTMSAAMAADVIVRVSPPRAVVERRPARPYRESVWVPGYHAWDGSRHHWVAGRWERPPQPRQRWEAHHWVKRNGGWVLVDGRWR